MAQFIQDSSTGSSDSSSSSSSGSESDLDFDVVRPVAVKSNEAGPGAQSSSTEKEKEGDSKEKETTGSTGKANQKTNKEAKREKTQEVHKEKLTPDRTVLLLKKIIGNQKKRAAKDKKKFSKVLRSASADARKYKLILNKVTKKSKV